MKVLVVLDHPYTIVSAENVPHQRSFSAAVAAAAIRGARSAGHEVDLIDLAADGFQVLTKGVMYEELPQARATRSAIA
jgi:NAD(P)H dehydrogenase (quinone)